MIVIGLDGATWDVIKPNLASLPAFSALLGKYMHSTLVCDVRPVHSAPSWTTIFSGKTPEEHGILHFVMGESARNALMAKKMFVWDRAKRPIVMGIPVSLPPINVNFELRGWESVVLSTTSEEMKGSTEKLLTETVNAIRFGESDLVAVVFSEPDRAQHIFWHEPEKVLEHYKSIDSALSRLMPHLEGKEFLILSDHGFTDAQTTKKNGWDTVRDNQTGGHHPDGIAISNRKPPEKVSEVCSFIASGMKI
ncbi:MAG TPA: alkaline phosphatase family protein [Candidatus Bilamarchaeum sp.]|nr:alkaline phosphatase family protein [Candidatus Bilamarchaeum sp.]